MLSLAKYIMSRKQTHNFSNRNLIRTSFSSTLQRPSCDWEPQLTLVPSAYTGLATTSEELGEGQRDGDLGSRGRSILRIESTREQHRGRASGQVSRDENKLMCESKPPCQYKRIILVPQPPARFVELFCVRACPYSQRSTLRILLSPFARAQPFATPLAASHLSSPLVDRKGRDRIPESGDDVSGSESSRSLRLVMNHRVKLTNCSEPFFRRQGGAL